MAEIILRTRLDNSEIDRGGQELVNKLNKALDAAAPKAKEAGKKIGNALDAGIKEGLRGGPQLQQQVLNVESAHRRRIEAIAAQSNARLVEIERRKDAAIDLIRARGVQKELEHARKLERETQRGINNANSLRSAIAGVQGVFATLAAVGAASFFANLARTALDAAVNIDRQVNSLKALTGSAEVAQRRFAELIAIAQKTPGLTSDLAITLDTQLRILNVTEQTINKILPTIGRLNAIAPLGNPQQFVGNLTQLVTQNFERQDLKELVGNSPFAGELIKEIFNVDSPTNAKAIRESAKKLGIRTVEDFFTAFSEAAQNNPKLQAVTESLGTQFEKLRDRVNVALAPLGEQLGKVLLPIFDELVKSVETFGEKASQVFRENRNDIVAAAKQIAALTVELGKAAIAIGELFAKSQIPEALGRAAAEFQDIVDSRGANLFTFDKGPKLLEFERKLALIEAERKLPRLTDGPTVLSGLADTLKGIGELSGQGKSGRKTGAATDRERQKSELAKELEDVAKLTKQVEALRQGEGKLFDEQLKLIQARIDAERLRQEKEQLGAIRAKIARGEALAPVLPGGIGLPRIPLITQQGPGFQATFGLGGVDPAEAADVERKREQVLNQQLRIQEAQIQNQVTLGLLSQADAQRQLNVVRAAARDEIIKTLEVQRQHAGVNSLEGLQITEQIERVRLLGVELSNAQRFMRGFGSATETVGDAFERLGQNVSRALTNTKDLLGGLKTALKDFFNDLLGQGLQNLMRQVLGPIVGGIGGAVGGPGVASQIGNIFRTPGTFPVNLAQAFAGGGGGGLAAPPSVTSQIASQFFNPGGPFAPAQNATGIFANGAFGAGLAGGGRGILSGVLNKVFGGGAVSPFPALLGGQLGAGLGGQSLAGNILGAIGGGAVGLGLSFGASVFSAAGGGLGALGPAALAALGPAALIGAPLLVGAILLGKAAQRRKDEEASGQFLTQALQGIEQLASGIATDQIEGAQARALFDTQILGTFKQQISGLKTKSVVQSRLTNQVRDLEGVYQSRITPLIEAQQKRHADAVRFAEIDRRLVPQFAIGGISGGGLAILHPNEMVLTVRHQQAIQAMAGSDVFNRAGVPGVQQQAIFDRGGIMPTSSAAPVIVVNIDAVVDSEGIFIKGGSGRNGERVIAGALESMRTRGRQI
jgi:hypothetical protein